MGSRGGSSEVSTTRTSKTGWLQDSDIKTVEKLSGGISWVTGLATKTWDDDAELPTI